MKEKIVLSLLVIGAIVAVGLLYLVMSYLFMLAFNYVARYVGFKEINFLVAVCVVFLLGFVGTHFSKK